MNKYAVAYSKKRYSEFMEWISKIKTDTGCQICGLYNNSHPEIFDFHHKEFPKSKDDLKVSHGNNCNRSRKKIIEEIKKCIVVCSNCHRIIHNENQKQKMHDL